MLLVGASSGVFLKSTCILLSSAFGKVIDYTEIASHVAKYLHDLFESDLSDLFIG